MTKPNPTFAYFGGEPIGVPVLEALLQAGFVPSLVVTNPDRPTGRKQLLTPPPVKVLAETNQIPILQPERIPKDTNASHSPEATPSPRAALGLEALLGTTWDLFVVVAYNHILPKWLIELPAHGTLNVHPSLLPAFRGPSPIRSAILNDMQDTGVTIMQMDEQMDHGPIVAQRTATIAETEWPLPGIELDHRLAALGGQLLVDTIPAYLDGTAQPREQDHTAATYTKKFSRADGELMIDPYALPGGFTARQLLLKIRAFDGFPGTFFMHEGKRIKINEAQLTPEGQLRLISITPEGKASVLFDDYMRQC